MDLGRKVARLWANAGEEAKGIENLTELLTRVALFFSAGWILFISYFDWVRTPFFASPGLTVALLGSFAIGIANLVAAAQVWIPARRIALLVPISIAYLVAVHYWVFVFVVPFVYGTDGMAFSHYSAILVLQGQNPYTTDHSPAFDLFPIPSSFVTPTESGTLVTSQTYPALSFLMYVPLVAFGVADMRVASLAAHMLTILLLYRVTPPPLRSFAPLSVVFLDSLDYTPGSIQDILWVPALVLSFAYLHRRSLAGSCYGIACAIKPIPWLVAPFLFLYLWKRDGTHLPTSRTLWSFVGFALGFFLLFNAPFIALDPTAWTSGVLNPLLGGNQPLGAGLSVITQGAWIPIPRAFYFVAMATVASGLVLIEFLDFPRAQYVVWTFPVILMFFSYRSLQNYFVYWYPLIFLGFAFWFHERIRGSGR